ncbi:hypothetical protein G6F70_007558 [Rhizopus microsporus]|uniref:Myb-like domain-containing protein n=1 Tax=Rhizopus azygosporus TaxID=86630 RepID=A0A367JU97_RHIAZ|nr:hypothetical protein G6F71_005718 [Rhizopus microsporus]RCH93552.1 hypothetical protein CU097_011387 [Rhizopus azygosporus]KAG1196308.1 hypothetical protein G6F70_007558 [Rhizopus microsporus]KAG1207777.1 hypothetical protein G6F69_007765 [Rhizopus microsporus]KAG1236083.1 hypothetical protein G6F67_002261 [Rhizopus microsporus]
MKIADMLNPTSVDQLVSPPPSPQQKVNNVKQSINASGKSRSRFSNEEDAIICEGVARGLTWGQISHQLPHRKRATCFNRYRTLQGIRKSRKRYNDMGSSSMTSSTSSWLPSPPLSSNHLKHYHQQQEHQKQRHQQSPTLVAPLPLHYAYVDRIH